MSDSIDQSTMKRIPASDGTGKVGALTGFDLAGQNISCSRGIIANMARIRVLAAFGIVWFHTESAAGRDFGYAGLPIFLMVSCSLIAAHSYSYDIKEFVTRRAKRLLIPWIFWSLIYAAFKFADSVRKGEDFLSEINISMLATGVSVHLWYLPYAFIAAVIVYMLTFLVLKKSAVMPVLISVFAGAGIIFGSSMAMSEFIFTAPLGQWLFASGAVPVGLAFGLGSHIKNNRYRITLFCIITLVTLGACAGLAFLGFSQLVIPYSVAVILVFAAHIWHGRLDAFSVFMNSMTYGIYLIHPLVFRSINVLYKLDHTPLAAIILTFVLSTVVVYFAKKTFIKRFV